MSSRRLRLLRLGSQDLSQTPISTWHLAMTCHSPPLSRRSRNLQSPSKKRSLLRKFSQPRKKSWPPKRLISKPRRRRVMVKNSRPRLSQKLKLKSIGQRRHLSKHKFRRPNLLRLLRHRTSVNQTIKVKRQKKFRINLSRLWNRHFCNSWCKRNLKTLNWLRNWSKSRMKLRKSSRRSMASRGKFCYLWIKTQSFKLRSKNLKRVRARSQ